MKQLCRLIAHTQTVDLVTYHQHLNVTITAPIISLSEETCIPRTFDHTSNQNCLALFDTVTYKK